MKTTREKELEKQMMIAIVTNHLCSCIR